MGIDLVPRKTCSFNCVFCQVGRTDCSTVERREYVPTEAVVAEFDEWLERGGDAEAVTLTGSGEPTLHTRFGVVLDAIRSRTAFRSVLLTNSSLMPDPAVRQDATKADTVKVSLSAWNQAVFERINRPHPSLRLDAVFAGLKAFRAEYVGELWVEVFMLQGVNDAEDGMRRLAEMVNGLAPQAIHLNTVARPPAEPFAKAVALDRLAALSELFEPRAEIVAGTYRAEDDRLPGRVGDRPLMPSPE